MKTTLTPQMLAPILESIASANAAHERLFPGDPVERQPVHTVYGGAHLFTTETATKFGSIALDMLRKFAPDSAALEKCLGSPLSVRGLRARAGEAGARAGGRLSDRLRGRLWRSIGRRGRCSCGVHCTGRGTRRERPSAIHRHSHQAVYRSASSTQHSHTGSVSNDVDIRIWRRPGNVRRHLAQDKLRHSSNGAVRLLEAMENGPRAAAPEIGVDDRDAAIGDGWLRKSSQSQNCWMWLRVDAEGCISARTITTAVATSLPSTKHRITPLVISPGM